MGTAFSSSLFGLAGSLILGFLDIQDDARVLLVVEQTTRGKSAPQPQTRRQQLDVFLVRITAGWRVDWVDIR